MFLIEIMFEEDEVYMYLGMFNKMCLYFFFENVKLVYGLEYCLYVFFIFWKCDLFFLIEK